jgi:hypothetical protein
MPKHSIIRFCILSPCRNRDATHAAARQPPSIATAMSGLASVFARYAKPKPTLKSNVSPHFSAQIADECLMMDIHDKCPATSKAQYRVSVADLAAECGAHDPRYRYPSSAVSPKVSPRVEP